MQTLSTSSEFEEEETTDETTTSDDSISDEEEDDDDEEEEGEGGEDDAGDDGDDEEEDENQEDSESAPTTTIATFTPFSESRSTPPPTAHPQRPRFVSTGTEPTFPKINKEEESNASIFDSPSGVKRPASQRIRVSVRVRPALPEEGKAEICVFPSESDPTIVSVTKSFLGAKDFRYDHVFGSDSSQRAVYLKTASPIVKDVMEGYNGAILCYGQTGSGKTYTMGLDAVSLREAGLVQNAFDEIFEQVTGDTAHEYRCTMSYAQIYMEMIQDLLQPRASNLQIREEGGEGGGVYISGISAVQVHTTEEALAFLYQGNANRVTAFTNMNAVSSRSHAVIMVTITRRPILTEAEFPANAASRPKRSLTRGKLIMVDLAGSERVKLSGAEGLRANEAKAINLSLSCLGNVIHALTDAKATHVPYRDSKLTRLMQDALGGNSKTSLVVSVSPLFRHSSETTSSLLFGQRAMHVKMTARQNVDIDYKSIALQLQAALDVRDERVRLLEARIAALESAPPTEVSVPFIPEKITIELSEANERCARAEAALETTKETLVIVSQANDELKQQIATLSQELEILGREMLNTSFNGIIANLCSEASLDDDLRRQIESTEISPLLLAALHSTRAGENKSIENGQSIKQAIGGAYELLSERISKAEETAIEHLPPSSEELDLEKLVRIINKMRNSHSSSGIRRNSSTNSTGSSSGKKSKHISPLISSSTNLQRILSRGKHQFIPMDASSSSSSSIEQHKTQVADSLASLREMERAYRILKAVDEVETTSSSSTAAASSPPSLKKSVIFKLDNDEENENNNKKSDDNDDDDEDVGERCRHWLDMIRTSWRRQGSLSAASEAVVGLCGEVMLMQNDEARKTSRTFQILLWAILNQHDSIHHLQSKIKSMEDEIALLQHDLSRKRQEQEHFETRVANRYAIKRQTERERNAACVVQRAFRNHQRHLLLKQSSQLDADLQRARTDVARVREALDGKRHLEKSAGQLLVSASLGQVHSCFQAMTELFLMDRTVRYKKYKKRAKNEPNNNVRRKIAVSTP